MKILGIDPGISGALALVGEDGRLEGVMDMPVLAAEGAKGRRVVDGPALLRLLRKLVTQSPIRATLENVRSMPRDGHAGAFAFGRTFGKIETALEACGIPYVPVAPQVWKKKLGVPSGSNSQKSDHVRAIASRLMPEGSALWTRKMDADRAEAALIAYYGSKYV
jgi:crossover junction endodeoxyribonuclease RuvC